MPISCHSFSCTPSEQVIGEVVFDAILEPTHSDSRDEGSNENL
jgi:hypothetical protein